MGGREARATLLFVLVSLLVGAAYRSWIGPDGPTFVERLRVMEERAEIRDEGGRDARSLASGSGPGDRSPGLRAESPADGGGATGSLTPATRAGLHRSETPPLGRLDVDRATAAEFERLPGIGPALAARIVTDRSSNGPFGTPAGLLRVRGIGPKTLERLRPFLRPAPADSVSPFAK
jgi:competence ComEA-like helix-hairpin-helix protein